MKMRALLLIAILIGGTYAMIQSYEDGNKTFSDLVRTMNPPFTSLLFTKPSTSGFTSDTWHIDDKTEIDSLLDFLQNYHVRKLKPDEIDMNDNIQQFSIRLNDDSGNSLNIIVNENLIIQNSLLYYEIVDGPLDVDWVVRFFINNQI